MARIGHSERAALSRVLQERRLERGWSQETLAEKAQAALHHAAQGPHVLPEQRELWVELKINPNHVVAFENHPTSPLGSAERRARLRGVVLALEVDREIVNLYAGGV